MDEPKKDLVTTQTRLSCCSGNKIANVFRKNVFLKSNLLKKSKSNIKHKQYSFTMFQVKFFKIIFNIKQIFFFI